MSINEMENKVKELKELQALIEEAEAEAETLKDIIKSEMASRGTDEISTGIFKVRYITVKNSRFDSKSFQAENPELYRRYVRTNETRRFSIV